MNKESMDQFHKTSLHQAILGGNLEEVKQLVLSNSDVNAQYEKQETPLHLAASAGNREIVTHLLQNRADIHSKTADGRLPLHIASLEGHKEVIESLLDPQYNNNCKADVNTKDNDGNTPLDFASRTEYQEVAQLLIDKGANIKMENKVQPSQKYLPTNETAPHTSIEKDGKNALHYDPDIAEAKSLIINGADVNQKDNFGRTPLFYVSKAAVAELLIHKGANINERDNDGSTPLHYAIIVSNHYPPNIKLVKVMIENGADLNEKRNDGKAPLHLDRLTKEIVILLIANGASPKVTDNAGKTPLEYAIERDDMELAELFQKNDDDIWIVGYRVSLHMQSVFLDIWDCSSLDPFDHIAKTKLEKPKDFRVNILKEEKWDDLTLKFAVISKHKDYGFIWSNDLKIATLVENTNYLDWGSFFYNSAATRFNKNPFKGIEKFGFTDDLKIGDRIDFSFCGGDILRSNGYSNFNLKDFKENILEKQKIRDNTEWHILKSGRYTCDADMDTTLTLIREQFISRYYSLAFSIHAVAQKAALHRVLLCFTRVSPPYFDIIRQTVLSRYSDWLTMEKRLIQWDQIVIVFENGIDLSEIIYLCSRYLPFVKVVATESVQQENFSSFYAVVYHNTRPFINFALGSEHRQVKADEFVFSILNTMIRSYLEFSIPQLLRVGLYLLGDTGVGKTAVVKRLKGKRVKSKNSFVAGAMRTALAKISEVALREDGKLIERDRKCLLVASREIKRDPELASESYHVESSPVTFPHALNPVISPLGDSPMPSIEKNRTNDLSTSLEHPAYNSTENISSKILLQPNEFLLDIYDLGGHEIYQVLYSSVVKPNGLYAIVLNLAWINAISNESPEDGNIIIRRLQYWMEMLNECLGENKLDPTRLLIILTHEDQVFKKDADFIKKLVLKQMKSFPMFPECNVILLNCLDEKRTQCLGKFLYSCARNTSNILQRCTDELLSVIVNILNSKNLIIKTKHLHITENILKDLKELHFFYIVDWEEFSYIFVDQNLYLNLLLTFVDNSSHRLQQIENAVFQLCPAVTCSTTTDVSTTSTATIVTTTSTLVKIQKENTWWLKYLTNFWRGHYPSEKILNEHISLLLTYFQKGYFNKQFIKELLKVYVDDKLGVSLKTLYDIFIKIFECHDFGVVCRLAMDPEIETLVVPALMAEDIGNRFVSAYARVTKFEKRNGIITPLYCSKILCGFLKFIENNNTIIDIKLWRHGCIVEFSNGELSIELLHGKGNQIAAVIFASKGEKNTDSTVESASKKSRKMNVGSTLRKAIKEFKTRNSNWESDFKETHFPVNTVKPNEVAHFKNNTLLAELHTHLTGMGTAEFWIYWIMNNYTQSIIYKNWIKKPRLKWDDSDLWSALAIILVRDPTFYRNMKEWWPTNDSNVLSFPVNRTNANKQLMEDCKYAINLVKQKYKFADGNDVTDGILRAEFTNDIVYSYSVLCKALLGCDEAMIDIKDKVLRQDKLSAIEKILSNSHTKESFRCKFARYIIFNVERQCFQSVLGIPNRYLIAAMELDKPEEKRSREGCAVEAAIRNCFSMLNKDGTAPKQADLADYRGCFTPKFYPMRFALKSSMLEQDPQIYSMLLNKVIERYHESGVHYVEFSLNVNTLLNDRINLHLKEDKVFKLAGAQHHWADYTDWYYQKPSSFQYKFLASFSRSAAKYPQSMPWTEVIPKEEYKSRSVEERRKFVAHAWPSYRLMTREARDDFVSKMYPDYIARATQYKDDFAAEDKEGFLNNYVVGLDLVSDEDGYPFSPFLHSKFFDLIDTIKRKKPLFGVRLHGGENVKRGSSCVEREAELLRGSKEEKAALHNFAAQMNIIYFELQELHHHTNFIERAAAKLTDLSKYLEGVNVDLEKLRDPIEPLKGIHNDVNALIKYLEEANEALRNVCDPMKTVEVIQANSQEIYNLIESLKSINVNSAKIYNLIKSYVDSQKLRELTQSVEGINGELQGLYKIVQSSSGKIDFDVPCLRIGHGIAFSYPNDLLVPPCTSSPQSIMCPFVDMRKWLKNKRIPLEINMTSNDILLNDLYIDIQGISNVSTVLEFFLQEKLVVVLSTDDDGIWIIHKCRDHHHHVSVMHEYCMACSSGKITVLDIHAMIENSWRNIFDYDKGFFEKVHEP